jgi:integrase
MGARTKLTVKQVENFRDPGRYSDENGLSMIIDKAGRKYWVVRFTQACKRREMSLGPVGVISLADARTKALEMRQQRVAGIDPAAERAKIRLAALTFADAARQVHEARKAGYRNDKHAAQWLTTLETYVFPLIGETPLAAVTRADIVQVLSPIWLKIPETARRVRQRIGVVIDYGVGLELREHGIDMKLITKALPKQPKRDGAFTAMPWSEVTRFIRTLALAKSAPQIRAGLEFLVLTASRPGNVRLCKWEQIDFDSATWTIPAEEMKGGKEHRVHLPDRALELLEIMEDLRPENSPYVFPGASMDSPLSLDAFRMAMRRLDSDCDPHGFRSSFKDWSLNEDWPDYLSEKQLAHTDPDSTRRAYARSDLLDRRRQMMDDWADYVTGTKQAKDKIVPLQASRQRPKRFS